MENKRKRDRRAGIPVELPRRATIGQTRVGTCDWCGRPTWGSRTIVVAFVGPDGRRKEKRASGGRPRKYCGDRHRRDAENAVRNARRAARRQTS